MPEIRKPAIRLEQGKHILYFTVFTVRDFIEREKFYNVDRLDVYEGKGMQRLLNESRAKELGKDFLAAAAEREASLPTSIFLATEGSVDFDESKGEIVFDPSPKGDVCPLDVVDGQHRIEGLRAAVDSAGGVTDILDFPIPAVIAPNMSEPQRMLQFVVVNTKQQKVALGVRQHIIARFTTMLGVESLPYIPQWLKREVDKGDDDHALTIVKRLNADENSPWYNLIQLADDERPAKQFAVKQQTMVTLVKRYLLTPNHMLWQITPEDEKQIGILKNYWATVLKLFVADDPRNSVAFKQTGLVFFLSAANPILQLLAQRGTKYTPAMFEQCFVDIAGRLESDAEMLSPLFWVSGGIASSQNRAAISHRIQRFNAAVQSIIEDKAEN